MMHNATSLVALLGKGSVAQETTDFTYLEPPQVDRESSFQKGAIIFHLITPSLLQPLNTIDHGSYQLELS